MGSRAPPSRVSRRRSAARSDWFGNIGVGLAVSAAATVRHSFQRSTVIAGPKMSSGSRTFRTARNPAVHAAARHARLYRRYAKKRMGTARTLTAVASASPPIASRRCRNKANASSTRNSRYRLICVLSRCSWTSRAIITRGTSVAADVNGSGPSPARRGSSRQAPQSAATLPSCQITSAPTRETRASSVRTRAMRIKKGGQVSKLRVA